MIAWQHSNPAFWLNFPPKGACCAAVRGSCFLLILGVSSLAMAEDARQDLLAKTPLAECNVQTLPSQKANPSMPVDAIRVQMPTVENPLSYYARQIDGQWHIPRTVDRKDPWVRLLILAPSQPVLVDIAVLVDGEPYRSAREQWIDLLLQQAKKESLVSDALAVSTVKDKSNDGKSDEPPKEKLESSVEETDTEETTKEAGETIPTTTARMRQSPTIVKRLINYLATGGVEEDREEIRWLLAEWADGPALLALGPAWSWQRVEVAPLWNCLDHDHDGVLSAVEIREAATKLRAADVDEDEVIDLEELQRSGEKKSPYPSSYSHPLIVVLDGGTAWDALHKNLVTLYGHNGNQPAGEPTESLIVRVRRGDFSLTSSELDELMYVPADVSYRVDLSKENGKVSLLATGLGSEDSSLPISANEQVVTVKLAESYLELTAATGEPKSKLDLRHTQIAIGAIADGYPLFRLLDRDNNHRLTLREQRQLADCLSTCDINGDGQIDSHEIPTAIRLTVTHGAYAHQNLALATAASHEIADEQRTAGPAWFVQMDRNHDGDLSRNEFLGTTKQFQQLDSDSDGLVSKKESQESSGDDE